MTSPLDTTTVAKVTNWLGDATPSTTAQSNIQDVITAWGLELLRLTGKGDQNNDVPTQSPFNEAIQYSEVYDGSGSNQQYLRNTPIISVESLSVGTLVIPASTGFNLAGYVIDSRGKSIILRYGGSGNGVTYLYPVPGSGLGFWQGNQNVFITYTAGFSARSVSNELNSIPSSSPYQITVQVPLWLSDLGVSFFIGGAPLVKALVAPNAGEYFVVGGGVYLFNVADAGKQVLMSYTAAGTPADVMQMSTHVVALTYKQSRTIGQKSQAMAAGAGSITFDWQIDDKDWDVINYYKRLAAV